MLGYYDNDGQLYSPDPVAHQDSDNLVALREKYNAMIETKKASASTTDKVFSIQEVSEMLQFCDKLNKANIELDRMLVNERSSESESDFVLTHGKTPHVKRPNFS